MENLAGSLQGLLICSLIFGVIAAGLWKVFEKAGQEGWKSLIPIYNLVVLARIGGSPGWLVLFLFIPLANLIAVAMIYHGVSRSFGKGILFTAGLIFLGPVFVPILGLGKARYLRPRKSVA